MVRRIIALGFTVIPSVLLISARQPDTSAVNIWGSICTPDGIVGGEEVDPAFDPLRDIKVAPCPPPPSKFRELPSIGGLHDTHVHFKVGYDGNYKSLCFATHHLAAAPVLRVGVGHALSITIDNTLHDTHARKQRNVNCSIETFGGEGICEPDLVFPEKPGADGPFYPLMANEAHNYDGTTNLHVHGMFVSPQACSDEVLKTTIYPPNWLGKPGAIQPCQPDPHTLTYTYQLPEDHPAGLYWYHTHRHGSAEHETQMGLAGAIVVQDRGDEWRESLGVTDEVLLVTDTPDTACLVDPQCDDRVHPVHTRRQPDAAAARDIARAMVQKTAAEGPAGVVRGPDGAPPPRHRVTLDPRIDQVDQAGECAYGATGPQGGVELWTLLVNGAEVAEVPDGFPPDSEVLKKTMQPGQRQIFRMVNASANSFIAPQLLLVETDGTRTPIKLEVFARDGVGMAHPDGRRTFDFVDVAHSPIIVPPSGRVEFVVHAPPPGAKLYLDSAQVLPGCGGNAYPARRLLMITAAGTPVNPGEPDDHDLLEHTPSLAPYLSTLGTTASVHRTFVFSEYGRGFTYSVTDWPKTVPNVSQYDPSQTDFFITQVAASDGEVKQDRTAVKPFVGHGDMPQVTVHLHGQQSVTEEWLIENSTLEIHAFHMHQVHFRVLDQSNSPAPPLPGGDGGKDGDQAKTGGNTNEQPLLDVVTVPAAPLIGSIANGGPGAPGWVKLRMTFTTADIGEFVYHCHILEHEDNGMMGKIAVVAD
jgi:FtsP/CotA-like multicopper oxidase with cupredoxin domain